MSRDSRLSTAGVREFVENLKEGATLPPIAIRLIEASKDPDYGFDDVSKLLASDQALTTKVLQIVNSTHSGQGGRILTLDRATVLFGMEIIRSIALSILVVNSFRKENGRFFSIRDLWHHNIACAIAAELLARRFQPITPQLAFIAGLLHDTGKMAIHQWNPDGYDNAVRQAIELERQLIHVEEELFGISHTQAGKILLENWGLTEPIVAAAWLHHQPFARPTGGISDKQIPFLIKCANSLVHFFRMGSSGGEVNVSQSELMDLTGLSLSELEQLSMEVLRRFEEVSGYFDWDGTSLELYLSAVAKANQELGERQLKLVIQNQQLTVQNSVTEAICSLLQMAGQRRSPGASLSRLVQLASKLVRFKIILGFMPDTTQGGLMGRIIHAGTERVQEAFLPAAASHLSEPRMDWTLTIQNSLPENETCKKTDALIRESLGSPDLLSFPVTCAGTAHAQILIDPEERLTPQEREGLERFARMAGLFLEQQLLLLKMEDQMERVARQARRADQYKARLYQADRLASVGRLAAGAAHEINNPLTTISAHAQLLERNSTDERSKKALQTIIDQANRISKIIGDLMGVARPASPRWERTTIADVIASTLETLESRIRVSGVEIKKELNPTLPEIAADRRQLEQVFLNLVLNALQATHQGGRLTIRTSVDSTGEQVQIEFQDTGRGIEPEKLALIFEPFYTTKGDNQGTGLGLAIANTIVEGHGGEIKVTSRPEGSTFTVLLPLNSRADLPQSDSDEVGEATDASELSTNQVSVLIVDDEDELRSVLAESLQLEGYRVEIARDGEEGLQRLKEGVFDLVLLDLRMPRRQGLEVLKIAKDEDPNLKIIVISGLTRTEELSVALQAGAFRCLKKPFTMNELLQAVREALSG